MIRVAASIILATLTAAPTIAATYSARPSETPGATRIIGKDISWARDGDGYRGSTDASRPLIICQDLAKRVGPLDSFAADGQPLSAEQLSKCNGVAKQSAGTAVAKAE